MPFHNPNQVCGLLFTSPGDGPGSANPDPTEAVHGAGASANPSNGPGSASPGDGSGSANPDPTEAFDPPMGPPIYCPFCVMYLNGPTQWENHKIGKKHRKAVTPYPGLFKLVHLAWAEFKAKTDGLKLKKVLYLRYYPLPLRPFATPH